MGVTDYVSAEVKSQLCTKVRAHLHLGTREKFGRHGSFQVKMSLRICSNSSLVISPRAYRFFSISRADSTLATLAVKPVGIVPGRSEPAPAKEKVETEHHCDQHDNGYYHGEKPHGAPPNIIRVHLFLLI